MGLSVFLHLVPFAYAFIPESSCEVNSWDTHLVIVRPLCRISLSLFSIGSSACLRSFFLRFSRPSSCRSS